MRINLGGLCRYALAAVLSLIVFVNVAHAQQIAQITQPVDPAQRKTLENTVHPLANSANDRGQADASLPMKDMVLLLQPSKAQTEALKRTIDNLHNASSLSFHQWLTPEQFAAQFGSADADLKTVSAWLSSSGFSIEQVARGKNWIRFSGTAGQVESAFQTQIHAYSVNGTSHYANATKLSIPVALAPAVTGVVSMNNFISTPQHVAPAAVARNQSGKLVRVVPAGATSSTAVPGPAVTTDGAQEENYLAPADFATIYNTQPLLASNNNGAGVSIAVVGRSDINISDVEAFRTIFSLPFNDPNIIYASTDPGDVSGDDVEATLDVEWAGAVAPQAKSTLSSAPAPAPPTAWILRPPTRSTMSLRRFFRSASANARRMFLPENSLSSSSCGNRPPLKASPSLSPPAMADQVRAMTPTMATPLMALA